MSTPIQIKRSENTAVPTSLANGELSYTSNGAILFIGDPANDTVIAIGGIRNPGILTANQAVVVNSTSGINNLITNTLSIGSGSPNVTINSTNISVGSNVRVNTSTLVIGNTIIDATSMIIGSNASTTAGITAYANGDDGIDAYSNSGVGVTGTSLYGIGIQGISNANWGVYGASNTTYGGIFMSTSGSPLYAGNSTSAYFIVSSNGDTIVDDSLVVNNNITVDDNIIVNNSINITSSGGSTLLTVGSKTGSVTDPSVVVFDTSYSSVAGQHLKLDLYGGTGQYGLGVSGGQLDIVGHVNVAFWGSTTKLAVINTTGLTLTNGINANTLSVFGSNSLTTDAIDAYSNTQVGVSGYSNSYIGVLGTSVSSVGVYGISNSSGGVAGLSITNYGVKGNSNSFYGVWAVSNTNYGLVVQSNTGNPFYMSNNIQVFLELYANGYLLLNGDFTNYGMLTTPIGAPSGVTNTSSTTGGSLAADTYYVKIVGVDAYGNLGTPSSETATTTTGTTSSIVYTWNVLAGATPTYRIYFCNGAGGSGGESAYFTSTVNNYTLTVLTGNTVGTPPTTDSTGNIKVGSNVTVNTSTLLIGNSTQFITVNSSAIDSDASGFSIDTIAAGVTFGGNVTIDNNLTVDGNVVIGSLSYTNVAIKGVSNTSSGVEGISNSNYGVVAQSNSGTALYGVSNSGTGLLVSSNSGQLLVAGNSLTNFVYLYANSNLLLNGSLTNYGELLKPLGAPASVINVSSTTGGTLAVNTYYAKIVGVDCYGNLGAPSVETVTRTTGTTSSIVYTWNILNGAPSYRIYIGESTGGAGGEGAYFTSTVNNFTLTTLTGNTTGIPPVTDSTGILYIGSNVIVNTSTLLIGNSTVNTIVNSSIYTSGNSTIFTISNSSYDVWIGTTTNSAISSGALFIGNSAIGTNTVSTISLIASSTQLFIGNSSVSASVNTSGFTSPSFTANSVLVNAAAINITNQINTGTFFATTSANVGANIEITTSAFIITGNSTTAPTLYITSNSTNSAFSFGNSTVTGAPVHIIANSIGNTVFSISQIQMSNSTANVFVANNLGTYVATNTLNLGSSNLVTTSAGANGYSTLPNGLKMLWGTTNANSTALVITFTTATGATFASNCFSVQATGNTIGTYVPVVYSINATAFTLITGNTANASVSWLAIGK